MPLRESPNYSEVRGHDGRYLRVCPKCREIKAKTPFGLCPDCKTQCYQAESVNVCDECNKVRTVGDWPYCTHESGSYGFESFAEYIDPHILPANDPRAQEVGKHPILGKIVGTRITSREQRKRIMKENNLDWAPREYGGINGSGSEF